MKYKFTSEWENYSEKGEGVKDLIAHMFVKEDERFTGQEVLNHRWIKEKEKNIPYNIEDPLNQIKFYQKMDNFEKKLLVLLHQD